MKKENKELLQKIYKEELEKATTKAKEEQLNRQIADIKQKAREKAQKRYGKRVKKKTSAKHRKTVKHIGRKAQQVSDDLLDMFTF